MKDISRYVSLLAVSVFAVGLLAVAPVSARHGEDATQPVSTTSTDDSVSSGSGSTSGSSGSGSGSGSTTTRVRTSEVDRNRIMSDDNMESGEVAHNETEAEHSVELKSEAKKLLAAERKDKKGKSVEQRQQSCEARKANLLKKSENYSRNATKHLEVFNNIYSKVQAFQTSKNLTSADLTTLKAAADAKQTAATTAVAALKTVSVEIDCTTDDPAATVATLKASVKDTRTALHAYRVAVKDLVVGLQKALPVDDTPNGGDTTETNDSGTDSPSDTTEETRQ